MNTDQTINKFNHFADNTFSQFGEDGILKAILDKIPNKNQWCVEFGAWDGFYLSNTCRLITEDKYKSVLIEADSKKFEILKNNMAKFDAILINKFVHFKGKNTLDNILASTPIPIDFDVLSIDIDGNDYHIFESLINYKPKIICIEYNPTIPNDVEFVQPKDFSIHFGSSALSTFNLAKQKGYKLAAVTKCNLILVESESSKHLNLASQILDEFRDDSEYKISCFVGYNGELRLSKPINLPWHNLEIGITEIQVIPSYLRKFRATYSWLQKAVFYFYSKYKNHFIRK